MHSTRRGFFKQTVTTLGAAGLLANSASPRVLAQESATPIPSPPVGLPKLGLVTYNLAKDWDIETLLRNCAQTGFEGVELRTTHRHGVEVERTAAERAEIRKRFEDSPVDLYGLGSAFDYHTPDPAQLRRDIEATKTYIQLSHDVGASGVKVRPNGLPAGVPVEKTLEQIGNSLQELGRFGADLGQEIRLEVHGRGTSQLPHIATIMKIADHPNVGVCWNSNQTDLDGDGFEANFNLVKHRINEVHLRDLFLDEYPWRRLFQRLLEVGYDGFTLAEIPESRDPLRVMKYFRALWLSYQDRN